MSAEGEMVSESNAQSSNPDRMAAGARFGRLLSFWVVGLAVVVLVVDFVLALINVRDLRRSEDLVTHGNIAVKRLEHVRSLVNEVALYSRGYLLIGDAEFAKRTAQKEGEVDVELTSFQAFTILSEQQGLVKALQQQVRVAFDGVSQEMATRPPGTLLVAEVDRINQSVPATRVRMDAVRRTVEQMQATEASHLLAWEQAANLRLRRTVETLVAAVIVSLTLIGLVFLLITRESRFPAAGGGRAGPAGPLQPSADRQQRRGHLRRRPGRPVHVPEPDRVATARARTGGCPGPADARRHAPPPRRRRGLPGGGVPDLPRLQGRRRLPGGGRVLLPGGRDELPGRVHGQPDRQRRPHRRGRRHLRRRDPTQGRRAGGAGRG